mgnify:FL=1
MVHIIYFHLYSNYVHINVHVNLDGLRARPSMVSISFLQNPITQLVLLRVIRVYFFL